MSDVSITNQRCLSGFRHRFDLAEQISVAFGGREIGLASNIEAPLAGWAVMRADADRSVAVHLGNTGLSRTALSALSARLRSAVCVATTVRRYCDAEVTFIESDTIDEPGWWVVSAASWDQPIWIALRGEWSSHDEVMPNNRIDRVVPVRIFGLISELGEIRAGAETLCSGLRTGLSGCGLGAGLVGVSEGEMMVKIDEEINHVSEVLPGIRLDLGCVEIRLSDLLNLRPGSSVELAIELPLRGYLRCGESRLAFGELLLRDGGIVLRVVEVFE